MSLAELKKIAPDRARALSQAVYSADGQCRCGHDKFHHMVTPMGEYTPVGWFWVLVGVSTKPVQLKFTCRVCNEVVAKTQDAALLAQHL